MEKAGTIITIAVVFSLLFSSGNMSGNNHYPESSISDQATPQSAQTKKTSVQTKASATQTTSKSAQTKTKPAPTGSKSVQTKSKSTQAKSKTNSAASKPAAVNKVKYPGTVTIGTQTWAIANLNVNNFRNGDSIPEAKTNKEWVTAGESGKPAWCYYNNDPANGKKYGKLYNWYAVNDPRGLAPAGWTLPSDADWVKLTYYLGGQEYGRQKNEKHKWMERMVTMEPMKPVLQVSPEVIVLRTEHFSTWAVLPPGGVRQKARPVPPLTITLYLAAVLARAAVQSNVENQSVASGNSLFPPLLILC